MDLLIEGLLLLLLIGASLIWWVVLPARELRGQLRRFASGDYRPFILKKIPGFLDGAAGDLRLTAETLARQQAMLAKDEFSISTILGRMTEGVVIIGSDLRIRLVNEATTAMFNLRGKNVGFLLQEVFLSHELQLLAKRAASTGTTASRFTSFSSNVVMARFSAGCHAILKTNSPSESSFLFASGAVGS